MRCAYDCLRILLTAIAGIWVAAFGAGLHQAPEHIISVCDIVSNPNRYNGEHVTVEANVISSFHGILAVDSACHGVIRLWVPDNKADTDYGRTLLRSETEPGSGFHHGYIGGMFTALQARQNTKTNVRGTIMVDHLSGWLPGRKKGERGN